MTVIKIKVFKESFSLFPLIFLIICLLEVFKLSVGVHTKEHSDYGKLFQKNLWTHILSIPFEVLNKYGIGKKKLFHLFCVFFSLINGSSPLMAICPKLKSFIIHIKIILFCLLMIPHCAVILIIDSKCCHHKNKREN